VISTFLIVTSDSLSTLNVISVDHPMSFIEATCTIASSKLFLNVLDENNLPLIVKSFNSTTQANSSSRVTLTTTPSLFIFLTGSNTYQGLAVLRVPAGTAPLSSFVSSIDNVTS
jgi:hypothetical protein